jgi:hypothetical protein
MPWRGHDPRDPGVASEAATRVGEVLERAEARAREIREQAERSASDTRRTARHEAEGIAKEARHAAHAAARERVREISELRASIAARAGSLVEGLEGGELTAARLAELVAALGEAADRLLAEIVGDGPATEAAPEVRRRAAQEAAGRREPGARQETMPAAEARERSHEPRGGREPAPLADPLPEGAPIARRPKRTSSARFAAVMMAIQGSGRQEVAEHLAREHGLDDASELLDDVFGRADTTA